MQIKNPSYINFTIRYNLSTLSVSNTRNTMIKTISLLLIFLLSGFMTFASDEQATTFKAGNDLSINQTYLVEDGKLAYMLGNANWSNEFTNKKIADIISVGFDRESTSILPAYEVNLHLSIQKYDNAGIATGTPVIIVLPLDYDPVSTAKEIAKSSYQFNSHLKYEVTITDVKDKNSGNSVALPNNVFLDLKINTERYYAFNFNHWTSDYQDVINTNTNQLIISWDYMEGAEYYDLEWTYVNDYDNTGGQLSLTNIDFSPATFKFNSSRIRTKDQFYTIPLLVDQGYIVYRLRGVGRSSVDNYSQDLPGGWSTEDYNYTTLEQFRFAVNNGAGSKGLEYIV